MRSAWFIGVVTIFLLTGLSFLPLETLLRSIVLDDTFYYAKIAQNIKHHGKVSFDGVHETNGFHPLWSVAILPLTYIASNGEELLRAILLLNGVFSGTAAGLLWYLFRRHSSSSLEALLAWFITILFYYANWILFCGMEGGLVLLLLMTALIGYERLLRQPNLRREAILGVSLGLLFLSRLDALFLWVGIALSYFLREKNLSAAISGLRIGFISLIFPTSYLLLNDLFFGHPLPTSALIKMNQGSMPEHISHLIKALLRFFRAYENPLWILLFLILSIGIGWMTVQRISKQLIVSPLEVALFSAAIGHAAIVVVTVGRIYPWYLFF
ncbi:MAG: hypothetical protein N3E49_03435 [Bacteroidia bacterium]|nr:hypothetical protein [Bacteroidia bacterium]